MRNRHICYIYVCPIYVTYMYIYVTYMSGTYIAIYVKYMYKQHHAITDLWNKCGNILTCVCNTSMIQLLCVLLRFPCTQGNATNKIIFAVFKYIHVYYTCDKFK